MTDLARFQSHTMPVLDGCHLWMLHINHNGYGVFSVASHPVRAHRWIYEQTVGPIPDGYHIDHICNQRSCVNPAHLQAVTPQQHLKLTTSRRLTCKNGHPWVDNERWYSGKRRCATCHRDTTRRNLRKYRARR